MSYLVIGAVGVLFAVGVYMLLRRSLIKLVIGLALLGHGTNLLILAIADPHPGAPPIVAAGRAQLEHPYSDPLPAALVLTAIVIGFGLLSYTIVLLKRAYRELRTDDLDAITKGDIE